MKSRLWAADINVGKATRRLALCVEPAGTDSAGEFTPEWFKEKATGLRIDHLLKLTEEENVWRAETLVRCPGKVGLSVTQIASAVSALSRRQKGKNGAQSTLVLDGKKVPPPRPIPMKQERIQSEEPKRPSLKEIFFGTPPSKAGNDKPQPSTDEASPRHAKTERLRPVHVIGDRALEARIHENNRKVMRRLLPSLHSTMGVIPFVGAGLSAPFKFLQWGDLLRQLAPPKKRAQIEELVVAKDFEGAAELLYDEGRAADRLQQEIAASFDRKIAHSEFAKTAVELLPYLTVGPVITTNYDRVLEQAFENAGRTLRPIYGSKPDEIVPAIQRNESVLFKIHGDCGTRDDLTLTLSSYRLAYGNKHTKKGVNAREKLEGLLPILLMNRPMFFLGCSLETDRTLQIVKEVHERHASVAHYAILAASHDQDEFDRREETLRNLGISVLWFQPGRFARIRDLLRELIDEISGDEIAAARDSSVAQRRAPKTKQALGPALTESEEPTPTQLDLPRALREKLRSGQLIYFLGAAASGSLSGEDFCADIAKSHDTPSFERSRSDNVQHILDGKGRPALVNYVLEKVIGIPLSRTHRRFASLASSFEKQAAGRPRLIIMTTNYDEGLETAFDDAGAPHHLFVYQAHGEREGQFIHRAPSGRLRAVSSPKLIHDLDDDAPVIVKMNGGPSLDSRVEHTFAAATVDFYRLAAKIPDALPAFLVKAIQARSLLFLGHQLKEPDVEQLIRFKHWERNHSSWALWKGGTSQERAYWSQIGLAPISGDIDACMTSIVAAHEELRDGASR